MQTTGKEGREVVIIELEDWEIKEMIMKEKKKLRDKYRNLTKKNKIYIDHDLTREEREVQRRIRERANKERENGKS